MSKLGDNWRARSQSDLNIELPETGQFTKNNQLGADGSSMNLYEEEQMCELPPGPLSAHVTGTQGADLRAH